MRRLISSLLALSIVLTIATAAALAAPPAVTVYVGVSPAPDLGAASGGSTGTSDGREDAVRELRDALRHKKGIRLVDRAEDASIRVEVVQREEREEPGGGFGGVKLTKLGETIIRFHATDGKADVDLKGVGQGAGSRAAKDGAEKLAKWIERHRP